MAMKNPTCPGIKIIKMLRIFVEKIFKLFKMISLTSLQITYINGEVCLIHEEDNIINMSTLPNDINVIQFQYD